MFYCYLGLPEYIKDTSILTLLNSSIFLVDTLKTFTRYRYPCIIHRSRDPTSPLLAVTRQVPQGTGRLFAKAWPWWKMVRKLPSKRIFFGGFLLEGEIFGLPIKAPTFRIRKDYDYHMTHPVKLTSSYHGYLELVWKFFGQSQIAGWNISLSQQERQNIKRFVFHLQYWRVLKMKPWSNRGHYITNPNNALE